MLFNFFGNVLFLLSALALLVMALRAAFLLSRGARDRAGRVGKAMALFAGAYLIVLLATSLLSPPRLLPLHQKRCFDDWCVTVNQVTRTPDGRTVVSVNIANDALRVDFRPSQPEAYVLDAQQRRYDCEPSSGRPLDDSLRHGESFTRDFVFRLPPGTLDPGFVITEGGGPGRLIVGDDNSFLHPKTRTPLAAAMP